LVYQNAHTQYALTLNVYYTLYTGHGNKMKKQIKTLNDIARLRYDVVRLYDLPEFNGSLKAYVTTQLDSMIAGQTSPTDFIEMYQRINS